MLGVWVEPSLFLSSPLLKPQPRSLISNLASMEVNQMFTYLLTYYVMQFPKYEVIVFAGYIIYTEGSVT